MDAFGETIKEAPPLSLAWQLSAIPSPGQKPAARFNPRPPGVLQEGSASDAVLKYLIEAGGFKTEAQILWKVRRSHSAVSWACLYLLRQGLIEARPDVVRNSRYKKYRAARKVLAQANDAVEQNIQVACERLVEVCK